MIPLFVVVLAICIISGVAAIRETARVGRHSESE